jgi:hypothetical protein
VAKDKNFRYTIQDCTRILDSMYCANSMLTYEQQNCKPRKTPSFITGILP